MPAESDLARDFARHGELHCSGREQNEREQAQQRTERAVVLASEKATGGKQECVVQPDGDNGGERENGAAPYPARAVRVRSGGGGSQQIARKPTRRPRWSGELSEVGGSPYPPEPCGSRNSKRIFCDAGWRPWIFLKATTDDGLVGWAEITDSHGSPRGLAGIVEDLAPLVVGRDPRPVEAIYWDLYRATRQSPGSVVAKALAGIENALLDLKAKGARHPGVRALRRPDARDDSRCTGRTAARRGHVRSR